ncbi:glycosyltransferase family 61 protein [Jiella avicenniae]|uniref:Glycosyltransferase family 61 protein n=1 Tax=Jiella avicenniae TaxID=2907202 RepID=A0A9X1P216_9HYPH|nr:glycosyltransferase family 61 protein [Jiella avicenniae]MCE7028895.1 glycosyltransferase family 61 protein [Jiella avicenniae]
MIAATGLTRSAGGGTRQIVRSYDELPPASTDECAEAVYGGYVLPHFGHFMIESTARLWWVALNRFKGPVLFQTIDREIPEYAQRFFSLLGIKPVFLNGSEGVRVRSLIVPDAAAMERGGIHRTFTLPFQHLAERSTAQTGPEKLYVSRGQGVGVVFGELTVQNALRKDGFAVLDPTRATLAEQIAAFANAREIVGCTGSAMHNVLFCRRAAKVAYLCRGAAIPLTFPAIDQALGSHESFYVYAALNPLPATSGLMSPHLIDSQACCRHLFEAGFLSRPPQIDLRDLVEERDLYMREWRRLHDAKTAPRGRAP